MKIARTILSITALLAFAGASFGGGGSPPDSTPNFMATGLQPCDPAVARAISGSYNMMTRTAPFGMTINVDAKCNVWGAYARVPGWTTGGNITGRMIDATLLISLRQSNGLGGAGTMTVGYDAKNPGGYQLNGPVVQDGDPYPLNNWYGSKQPAAPGGKPTALNDVDVYAGPGGRYKVIGMMRKGASGKKLEPHADGWCKIQGVAGGADGWVANDHLNGC